MVRQHIAWWCLVAASLVACGQKTTPVAPAASAASQAVPLFEGIVTPVAEPAPEVTPEDRQAYQAMEERYAADPAAQWAMTAKGGLNLGESVTSAAAGSQDHGPFKATGPVDGESWHNSHDSEGTDWLELGFDRPVHATEVRVVMSGQATVRAITRVDAVDDGGQVYTLWEGRSEVSQDLRGPRTWFVRQFDKTPFKVSAIKLIFGNALFPGAKRVDAVQLVGQP